MQLNGEQIRAVAHPIGKVKRDVPINLQSKPTYPGLNCVVFSIRYPDWTAHIATERCPIEYPHLISKCAEFIDFPN